MERFNRVTNRIKLYVPSGVSLNRLVISKEEFIPKEDIEWYKQLNGVSSRNDSVKGNRLPQLLLFCTLLLYTRCIGWGAGKNSETGLDGRLEWLELGQSFIGRFIDKNDIPHIVRILKEIGLIETKPHVERIRNRGYRFTKEYENLKPSLFTSLEFKFPESKTEAWKSCWSRNPDGAFESRLCENIEQFEILPEARQYVQSEDYRASLDENDDLEASESAALSSIGFIESFSHSGEKSTLFKRDQNVRRIYSNITGLRSDLRKFLRRKGRRLVEIDLNGSHPYWLIRLYRKPNLLNDPEAQLEMRRYIRLWDGDDFYSSIIAELGLVPNPSKNQSADDLRKEVKHAFFAGFLYVKRPCGEIGERLDQYYAREFPLLHGEMKKRRNTPILGGDDPYWRKGDKISDKALKLMVLDNESQFPLEGDNQVIIADIKGELFVKVFGFRSKVLSYVSEKKTRGKKGLYAKLRNLIKPHWEIGEVPEALLGEAMPILGMITGLTKLNGQLAVENMRVESEAIIDGVAKENFETENYFLATIHDSIVIEPENALKAKALMHKNLYQRLGFVPELKVKWLGEKKVLNDSDLQSYASGEAGCDSQLELAKSLSVDVGTKTTA